ncbi:YecA family protein [Sporomusa malonica]|uniref:SEC-C motif-containing protein n=1 Tax=Sporomusa malonica TaxID=112901 RepID=A0A1W2AQP2_9FIRM|nr:SEC-C domain-containing protein [Sporomusa malonica]SMC63026.1 SEC-C motif-containing protein [Sporomusa malonica]
MDYKSISSNNFCPCMSGKKYKKCCEPIIDIIKVLPGVRIDEQYALKDVLANSETFRSFYNSERDKIKNFIFWCIDPNLNAQMRTASMSMQGDPVVSIYIIIIKKAPIAAEDAFDVAHELQHLICADEGYCSIGWLDQKYSRSNFASLIANITNDPTVNSRLAKFGFDLWAYYDKACSLQKGYFGKCNDNNISDQRQLIPLYLQKALDWDVACKISKRSNNDFLNWFDNQYPISSAEARKKLEEIKQMGYDTPEKSQYILKNIIKSLGLDNILHVSN